MCAEFPTFIKGAMVVFVKSLQGFFFVNGKEKLAELAIIIKFDLLK